MISVHYFASVRENLGLENETVMAPEGVDTVEKLIKHLISLHEESGVRGEDEGARWRKVLQDDDILVAVNKTMAAKSDAIGPNDEVAFFPPVTGG